MRNSHILLACLSCGALVATACAGSAPPPERSAQPAVTVPAPTTTGTPAPAPAPEPAAEGGCPPPADAYAAARHFEEGQALLESSRDGEHYRQEPFAQALKLLRQAAAAGHVEAQFRYGSLRFSTLFMGQAPQPDQEDEYVAALTYLRLAALGGHEEARRYVPGLDTLQIGADGRAAVPPDPPLDALPEPWVRRVVERSDQLARCGAHATDAR